MIPLGLVSSIHDSTVEAIIQRTINGIQRMISLHNNEGEKEKGETTTEPRIDQSRSKEALGIRNKDP
jgi:hypothetical protein